MYFKENGKFGIADSKGEIIIPPILSGISDKDVKLYEKGYIITEEDDKFGLSNVNGKVIIPCCCKMVYVEDDFVIITDDEGMEKLYSIDGKPIFEESYYSITVDSRTRLIKAESKAGYEIMKYYHLGR